MKSEIKLLLPTLLCILLTRKASAQRRVSDETMLFRICAHESTRFSLDDCAGIYSVLRSSADLRGHSFARSAILHSPTFFADEGVSSDARNAWTAVLDMDCARPPGLRASWTRPLDALGGLNRQQACLALAEHVRTLMRGPALCTATVWGSVADWRRRHLAGCRWEVADCGTTSNIFASRMVCPRRP